VAPYLWDAAATSNGVGGYGSSAYFCHKGTAKLTPSRGRTISTLVFLFLFKMPALLPQESLPFISPCSIVPSRDQPFSKDVHFRSRCSYRW